MLKRNARGAGYLCLLLFSAAASPAIAVQSPSAVDETIRLWDKIPSDTPWTGAELAEQSKAPTGESIAVKSKISDPTLTIVRPSAGKANGTAIIVAPGGAFMALAWDLEGVEVARWFADHGVTAFILKYRVGPPALKPGEAPPAGVDGLLRMLEPNRKIAVADAARAVRLVRARAADFGIAPDRIGMIGFSAGAMTTMGVILEGGAESRPDFAVPVYGMLGSAAPVPEDAPPLFIAAAADDKTLPAAGSVEIFEKWSAAKRPAELHVYERGNHGFGMRAQRLPVDHWTAALENWLTSKDLLGPGTR